MSCAARARRLMEDAQIIVLDKGSDVSVATCGLPYYLSGEIASDSALRLQTPHSLKAALNLDVRVNHDVRDIDAENRRVRVVSPEGDSWIDYDALVLSPGASAVSLGLGESDLPGVHHLRTIDDALNLRTHMAQGAQSALVIGGGFIGVEAAENLAEAGLTVDLVEAAPHILPAFDPQTVHPLRKELRCLGVMTHEGVGVAAITPHPEPDDDASPGYVVELQNGTTISVDMVVVATGVRARTSLAQTAGVDCTGGAINVDDHGRTNVEGIWAVGDATMSEHPITGVRRPVPLAGPANRAGRLVADDIAHCLGRGPEARPIPRPQGTAIVRVGNLMAASTGANRQSLEAAGIEYHAVHTAPNDHVAYFPGATPMFLTVYFDANGEILGAQGVGEKGVDRRIDVLATAMYAGAHVDELIDLDLCYAPPFGTAKDAVNMIGMLGENILENQISLWYPWEIDQAAHEWAIVDVRSQVEADKIRIPGSLCVPHTHMRERAEEIREFAAGRPIALHCKSGFRSYLAYRYLTSLGLEVKTLSGGIDVLENYLGDAAGTYLEYGTRAR